MKPFAFQNLVDDKVKHLTPYLPGRSITEIQQQYHIQNVIKLASNENPLGASPKALQKLQTLSIESLSLYPATTQHPLLAHLCEFLDIDKAQILITNGSDAAFSLLIQAYARPLQKKILTHQYAFMGYEIQAASFGLDALKAPVHPEDWSINIEALKTFSSERPALVFIANPNNPTGQKISWDVIENLLQHFDGETLFVLDEAYYEYDNAPHPYLCNLLETYPHLVITRTFSKAYGLAGLRIGYVIAHPEIIQTLKRIQLPFTINQSALIAANEALKDQDFIHQTRRINQEGMQFLLASLSNLPLVIRGSHGNFITVEDQKPIHPLVQYLESKGIIIRGLQAFGLTNVARITIGTATQNQRLCLSLQDYFKQKGYQ